MADDVYMIKFFTLLLVVVGNSSLEEIKVQTMVLVQTQGGSSAKIIGGNPAVIEKYPYAVQLSMSIFGIPLGVFCGGTLITRKQVMTAAHCVANTLFFHVIQVRMGATDSDSGGDLYDVEKYVMHEQYNKKVPKEHDIAVVVLKKEAVLSSRVATAWLPEPDVILPDNAPVWAVGWGSTAQGGETSDVLLEVQIRTINQAVCSSRYAGKHTISSDMMCAGILDIGGKDTCQGDSGGPLIYKDVVVGVTSWGAGCAQPEYPGVISRVTSHVLWLGQIILDTTPKPNPDNAHAPTPNYVLLPSVTLVVLILRPTLE